jgi:PAS domain S-box-containing protein
LTERKRAGGRDLRQAAEERAREGAGRPPGRAAQPDAVGTERLLHELRVHQIELELQNEELRASRHESEVLLRRYAELFDFAPFGYVRLDPRGTVVDCNFSAARLLGAERRRIAGRAFQSFVAAQEQGAYQAFFAALMAPDPVAAAGAVASMSHEFPLAHLGVDERWVRVVGLRLATAGEEPPTALLALEDVSARRHAEAALHAEAHHKDDFLAALSHELRNPLAPIRMALSLLRQLPPGSEQAAGSLSVLERQTAHLSRIVDDLLDVTRISRGKVRLERHRVELCELVRRTLEDHRATFDAATVGLRLDAPAARLWVDADDARLVQVIGNLLGNALKFTGPRGHVEVQLAADGDFVNLRVRDSGVGISPEVTSQLFVPFSQGPQGLERSRGGLGLGLATARGLVELHGGTITVRSEGAGRGAEFTVRLPLAEAPTPELGAATPGAVRPLRVLVIEDNEDAGETLKDLLELSGHVVRIAADGPSGLDLAHDFLPDLVLCDLGLPRMSGYEVARALRADEALHGALLVALSGYTQYDDTRRAGESGFDRHLSKPASPEVLDEVLHQAAQHVQA